MSEQEIKKRYLEIIKTLAANAKLESYTLEQLRCVNHILMYGANTTHLESQNNYFWIDEGWKVDYFPSSFLQDKELTINYYPYFKEDEKE